MALPAWVYGPFELLVHAELHFRAGKDFDRRMALISFDNAIEVAISTYLSLHPIQRKGKTYVNADVTKWLVSFPSKLEFIVAECTSRKIEPVVDSGHMIYYHAVRNEQYHEGRATIPTEETLVGIRSAALWVFGLLYDVSDIEQRLDERINSLSPDLPERDDESDKILDDEYGVIWFGETSIYASDLLFSHDPIAYRDLALSIRSIRELNREVKSRDLGNE
jgi:hypothetical protein